MKIREDNVFKFPAKIDLTVIVTIKANNLEEATELMEEMSVEDMLKHEIYDISNIDTFNSI